LYFEHVTISHLVASLPTSRQQAVFALLVEGGREVWNKLLTTCDNLVDIVRLVAICNSQQLVTTLLILSGLLQDCSDKSDAAMI
jgi:hypothetical protein